LAVASYAGPRGGDWKATEFQVQNLDDEPADFTARFYDPHGQEVLEFADSIPPGTSAYYRPEEPPYNLDPAFTGTLVLESAQNIAAAAVHFATLDPPHHNGVTVFETFDEAEAGPDAYAPLLEKDNYGFSSRVGIRNPGEVPAAVTVIVYDLAGEELDVRSLEVPPRGAVELDVSSFTALPPGFVGSAAVHADQPIFATVRRYNGEAMSSYPAARGGGALGAPLVAAWLTGTSASNVAVQNVGDWPTIVAESYGVGCETCPCRVINLGPYSTDFVTWPYTEPVPLYIFNNNAGPVAAVVTVDRVQAGVGSAAYAAFDVGRLGNRAAAPLAYGGYNDWYTRIWVQNLGMTPATVVLTYTVLPTGTSFPISAVADPGQAVEFPPPPAQHASAVAWADQPIAMLIEGYNEGLGGEDSRFYYRGTSYGPPQAHFFTNSPVDLGETVYFENATMAVPPLSFQWDFGDGGFGGAGHPARIYAVDGASGVEHPARTYAASGRYTVVMTATNPYGSVVISDVVEVYGPPRAGFDSSSPDRLGQATTFTNASTGWPAVSSYQWDFGDYSPSSSEPDPSHQYEAAGIYAVVLTATNARGSDTYIGRVVITPMDFAYLPLVTKDY
jgi:hypothetical protein